MIEAAVAAILAGQVVGVPTDTVYGIGVDPFDQDAVSRLFELKGRPRHKPVGVLVATVEQAAEIADLGETGSRLAAAHWPGALTLVARPKVVMADWVGDEQRQSIGIRVPGHEVALELLRSTGPLAVTSANRSGQAETMDDRTARALFGASVAVYLEGTAPGGVASTVVDVTGCAVSVLRQGPVAI